MSSTTEKEIEQLVDGILGKTDNLVSDMMDWLSSNGVAPLAAAPAAMKLACTLLAYMAKNVGDDVRSAHEVINKGAEAMRQETHKYYEGMVDNDNDEELTH